MKNNKKRRGFTIVELVIVIAVVAVLAGILIPTFSSVVDKAQDSKAMQEARNAYTEYIADAAASGNTAGYCVYEADENRFVAIANGSVVGVYESQADALTAMLDDSDTAENESAGYAAHSTGVNGLFVCTNGDAPVVPEVPNDPGDDDGGSKAAWDTDGDGVFELLAIGNSFSGDALQYVYQIAKDVGIEKIAIGNLFYSACSLNEHATFAQDDEAKYIYSFNDNGDWVDTKNYKSSTALQSRSWDFVMLQQASGESGVADTYDEDLDYMISYVKNLAPGAKLVWHMTWAYQQGAEHKDFPRYDNDQMTMYNAIVSAVKNKIVANGSFDLIVPNGTAVQNGRTSLLGDTTTRDGYHMSKDYGRYLTGLMVVKTVTGLPVDDVAYRPTGVDEFEQRIAIDAVNKAADNPYAVTKSAYPAENYELLDLDWTLHAYWHSEGRPNLKTGTNGLYPLFYSTSSLLPKQQLPVGSVIVVAEGWKYRPEGWVDANTENSERLGEVTTQHVVVTEEWWGDFTLRAFNVAKTTGDDKTVTQADIDAGRLKIYVPKGYLETDYKLLEIDWTFGYNWNSRAAATEGQAKNKQYYSTSSLLSPTDLPVGSVIVVEKGWQYRPEGWVNADAANSKDDRPATVKTQFVVVTEEWWGNFTLRAFNVSKVGAPDLENMTQDEMRAVLKIYVPKGQ